MTPLVQKNILDGSLQTHLVPNSRPTVILDGESPAEGRVEFCRRSQPIFSFFLSFLLAWIYLLFYLNKCYFCLTRFFILLVGYSKLLHQQKSPKPELLGTCYLWSNTDKISGSMGSYLNEIGKKCTAQTLWLDRSYACLLWTLLALGAVITRFICSNSI